MKKDSMKKTRSRISKEAFQATIKKRIKRNIDDAEELKLSRMIHSSDPLPLFYVTPKVNPKERNQSE